MNFDLSFLATASGKLMIAGALGGVVRWLTLREGWRDGLASIIVGGITAVFVGPAAHTILRPIVDLAGVEPDAANSLGGFLIGVGGILVSGFFIDLWRARSRMLKSTQKGEGQ
jgi:hypothetical protein